jgi:processing peptidase subunit beta
MNDVEVIRGRNVLYNQLMSMQSATDILQQIGPQMLYLNRRVPRSEIAQRVSHMDAYHMKHMCNEWFYDAEPSFTNWGPIETVSSAGSYKYYKVNTMSTVMNSHHTLFH